MRRKIQPKSRASAKQFGNHSRRVHGCTITPARASCIRVYETLNCCFRALASGREAEHLQELRRLSEVLDRSFRNAGICLILVSANDEASVGFVGGAAVGAVTASLTVSSLILLSCSGMNALWRASSRSSFASWVLTSWSDIGAGW
jgi:hypothetical protein